MRIRYLFIVCLLLVGWIVLPGCVSLQPPSVEFQDVVVRNIDLKKATLDFRFKIKNPNPIDIDHAHYNYVLHINDHEFIRGDKIKLKVPANKTFTTVIPVILYYQKLFRTTEALTQAILKGKRNLPYRLSGAVTFSAMSLSLDVPFDSQGDIPLPKLSDLSL